MKESDAALIQRTLDGDEGAFTTLVKKYQKWVHTLVWRKIGDFHTAEELTQDIFLKVYKKLSTLKPPDRFPGWLYVITTRHCITWLRKKRVSTTSLNTMPTTELEALCYARYEAARGEEASAEHQRELVKRLLQKLPESERTVVTLYYLAEMTSEEIGTFLGVSPNTIRSRLRRARKRLKAQAHLLHNVSSVFQLPPTLTQDVMREIARIKPASPSVSKPWLPWGLSFASTFLVILMIGAGPRALSRFQQPYSLDATSEMTIELVEDPVLLALELKRDLRNQHGITGNGGSGSSTGTKTNAKLLAAAQADTTTQLETKPKWIPAKGPGGGYARNLFVTSQKELYAIGGTRIYQWTGDNSAEWMLINAWLPTPATLIAERNSTLYIATQKHLFASTDRGATLIPVGPLPEGRAVALLITDPSQVHSPQDAQHEMYLVLTNGVFRSTDAGKTWHAFNEGLTGAEIQAAAVINNALFLGTNPLFLGTKQGLYRLNTGVWEKLPIAPSQLIESLAVAGNKIYFNTRARNELSSSLYVSNDFGESWTDITPPQMPLFFAKLAAIADTLWVIGDSILNSTDAGNTWTDLGPHGHGHAFSISGSAVVLDEDTLFLGKSAGVARSDDGGKRWHPFTAGIAETRIQDLAQANNVLYAVTHKGIATSTDGGTQWTYIQPALPFSPTSLTVFGDSLYFRRNKGDSANGLFHLQPHTDTLHPVEGMPVYVDANPAPPDTALERVPNAAADRPPITIKILEGKIRRAGKFTISGDTFYIEYERKLYRWTRGEHKWHDTGMQDAPVFGNNYFNGLQFAVSGKVIYLGKSDGSLFQSLDGGDTWRDITATFPFPLDRSKLPLIELSELREMQRKLPHFKDILYVGHTVYIITNDGSAMSNDGENWQPLTNEKSVPIPLSELAVKGTTLYGASETGAYRLNNETNTWIQIAPEVPGGVTSLAVADDVIYVGTNYRGILRLPLQGLE